MTSSYRTVNVDGLNIFFREAGDTAKPSLLLLHGFPTASHMFRDLIPLLAADFHLVAPDLPGFGQSAMPVRSNYSYTFDNLALTIERFTEVIGLDRFTLYIFDYGAPIGLRIAARHPDRVQAIITQSGNAYSEGLADSFAPLRDYWADPDSTHMRDALRVFLEPATTRFQYIHGVEKPELISPDGPALDNSYLARPGADEVQLDLMRDYASNVALYEHFQVYLRRHQPPVLSIWGKNDPFFLPEGALAFARDIQDCETELLETGHFALETHAQHIADRIRGFLYKRLGEQ